MSAALRPLGAGLLALILGAAPAAAGVVDRVAAVVNEEVIALSEVYDLGGEYIEQSCAASVEDGCVREAELEVLDSLVLRALVHQELGSLGLDVSGEEVDRTIDQMGRDYALEDRDAFRQEVERSGMAWDTYREQLTEQLRRLKFNENVIRPRISVSEDELRDLYNRTVRGVEGPQVRALSAISLAPEEGQSPEELLAFAAELSEQLRAGELEWAAAVEAHHTGIIGAPDGTMGTYARGDLTEALAEPVFSIAEGEISEPILLPGDAVVLIRVDAVEESDVRSYEESVEDLRNRLYEQKIEEETERWYQQARRRAAVEILLEAA